MSEVERSLCLPPRGFKKPSAAYSTLHSRVAQTFEALPVNDADIICLSHLRWDDFYQGPQYLLNTCGSDRRVYFFEDPVYVEDQFGQFDISCLAKNFYVVVPRLPIGVSEEETERWQRAIINELIVQKQIREYVLWYYTPMALSFTRHLKPTTTIYDCIYKLSAVGGTPGISHESEVEMFERADIVLTGSPSLYEAKCNQYHNIRLVSPIIITTPPTPR